MTLLLKKTGKTVEHLSIESDYGHDAFLVEYPLFAHHVSEFLAEC
jgi:homoserine acetyltransferase